jgi:hypothetical protein
MKCHGSVLRHGFALLALAALSVGCSDTGGESAPTTKAKPTTSSRPTAAEKPDRPATTTTVTTVAPPPPTTGAVVPEAAEFALGQKATYDDGSSVQVYGYEQPAVTDSILKPPAGTELAAVDVEVCTGSRAQTTITGNGMVAYAPAGGTYRADARGKFPSLLLGAASPGTCQRGFVNYNVPAGERASFVVWQEAGWEMARWKVG